ncbi:MAG: hypothetical protein ACYC66_00665 [Chloroflexota bacterium]
MSSLDYQHAFDLCAAESYRRPGPIAIWAGSGFCAREMRDRLPADRVVLVEVGPGWSGEEMNPRAIFHAAVWACPERDSGARVARAIAPSLAPGGVLTVVVSTALARLLPEWRTPDDTPGRTTPRATRAVDWLRSSGLEVRDLRTFHGPASVLWARAGGLLERLGRPDLGDRLHFKMRRGYAARVVPLLAPLVVVTALRPGGSAG